jgi:hypothetical protein
LKIAAGFYKNLFKWERREPFCLRDNFWGPTELVQANKRADLEAPFSEEEVRNVVFSSYAEGGGVALMGCHS